MKIISADEMNQFSYSGDGVKGERGIVTSEMVGLKKIRGGPKTWTEGGAALLPVFCGR
jgi:hypothetical protein